MGTDPQPIVMDETVLQAGERVVYPNQGVCRISGIEVKEIGGIRGEFLTMKREEDGATVMIPRAKVASVGLRHVAARSEVEALLGFLTAEADDPELDWKVRHRTHSDKMIGGSLLGTAEVLKGLHALSLLRPLPQRERELYDSARHLLVHEVAVALGMSPATAEDAIDLGLCPIAGSARAAEQARRISAAQEAELGLDDLNVAEITEAPATQEPPESEAAPPPAAEPDEEPSPPRARKRAAPARKANAPAGVAEARKRKPAAPKKKKAKTTRSKTAARVAGRRPAAKKRPAKRGGR